LSIRVWRLSASLNFLLRLASPVFETPSPMLTFVFPFGKTQQARHPSASNYDVVVRLQTSEPQEFALKRRVWSEPAGTGQLKSSFGSGEAQ